MTNVKNTTPNTLVAFCSRRMIRPWRDEFRDITLEFREWCERTVPQRLNKHGVDLFELVLLLFTFNIFETELSILRVVLIPVPTIRLSPNPFTILLWLRSVAERRSADVIVGTGFCEINVVWWPPKLEPRRDLSLFRVSHVTTVLDFVCGGVIEKLNLRMGTSAGDVDGVDAVELHIAWWLGAVNKCNVGAELPICNADPLDGVALKFRRDALFDAIAIGLLLIISGDNSSGFNSDTIRTSAFRCACDLVDPKYGHVHGGGNVISFNFVPFESIDCFCCCCCCCFSCTHNWLFDFSVEFRRFFRFFIMSVSSVSHSSSVSVSTRSLWWYRYTDASTSLSTFDCSSKPMSSCSMRGKLLHRFWKFNSEPCESLRPNPLDDHVEWDARRLLLLRRADDIGL